MKSVAVSSSGRRRLRPTMLRLDTGIVVCGRSGYVAFFGGGLVEVLGEKAFNNRHGTGSCSQIDRLDVPAAPVTHVETVLATLVREIRQPVLILVRTEWALQALEHPLGIAARTQQPPCPARGVKEAEIRDTATNRAVPTSPSLLIESSLQFPGMSQQERLQRGVEQGLLDYGISW